MYIIKQLIGLNFEDKICPFYYFFHFSFLYINGSTRVIKTWRVLFLIVFKLHIVLAF